MIDKDQIKLQRRGQIQRLPQTLDGPRRPALDDLDDVLEAGDLDGRPGRGRVHGALFQGNVTRSVFLGVRGPVGGVDRVWVGCSHGLRAG